MPPKPATIRGRNRHASEEREQAFMPALGRATTPHTGTCSWHICNDACTESDSHGTRTLAASQGTPDAPCEPWRRDIRTTRVSVAAIRSLTHHFFQTGPCPSFLSPFIIHVAAWHISCTRVLLRRSWDENEIG